MKKFLVKLGGARKVAGVREKGLAWKKVWYHVWLSVGVS